LTLILAAAISASGWVIASVNLVFITVDAFTSIVLITEVSGYKAISSLAYLLGNSNLEINKNQ